MPRSQRSCPSGHGRAYSSGIGLTAGCGFVAKRLAHIRFYFRAAGIRYESVRDGIAVHTIHLRCKRVAGYVSDAAIDELQNSPHDAGAVEETAENGFLLFSSSPARFNSVVSQSPPRFRQSGPRRRE